MIRLFDIFFSLISLLILLPLFFAIIILCWIDTRSPIFCQKRVGLNKKEFILFKFRTMQLHTRSVGTHIVDKSLITPLGHFLRNTKIDELPQILNVLIGDMSFVGPRPCLFNQKKLIFERNKLGVFKIKPGITGLAQLQGINMSTPSKLAKADYRMISNMNISNYFYYIFLTTFFIFKSKKTKTN